MLVLSWSFVSGCNKSVSMSVNKSSDMGWGGTNRTPGYEKEANPIRYLLPDNKDCRLWSMPPNLDKFLFKQVATLDEIQ